MNDRDRGPRGYGLNIVLISVFILALPLTMFSLAGLGSGHRLVTLLVLSGALVHTLSSRYPLSLPHSAVFWVGYASWNLLAVVWGSGSHSGMSSALGLALLIAALVVLAMLPLPPRGADSLKAAWMGVGAISVVLFFVLGERASIGGRTALSISDGGSDPNEFCTYLLMPLGILTARLSSGSRAGRLVALGGIAMGFYVVLMTGSRAGLLAAVVTVLVVGARSSAKGLRRALATMLILSLGAWIAVSTILPLVPVEVRERLTLEAILEDGGSNRGQIWADGIDALGSSLQAFLIGYGPMGYSNGTVMHNQFLQAWMDGGVIGCLLFVGLIASSLLTSWRVPWVFGPMLGVSAMLMTLTAGSNMRAAWTILAFGLLVCAHDKRERASGLVKCP